MKKTLTFTLIGAFLIANLQLQAQWLDAGAYLYTSDDVGIGLTSAPAAKLQINSASGQNGLRIQINGSTRLLVNSNGGVSVGSLSTPPANGLYVSGNAGIGTAAPAVKLQVSGGTTATLASGGYILSGLPTQSNIVIDAISINARTNGVADTLNLNRLGGLVRTGGNLDVAGSNVSFGSVETLSDAGANTIGSNSNFIPTSNDAWSLGNSTNRWASIWFTNGVITSDARLKKNIREMNYGLKEIMQLRPVKFNYKESVDQNDKLGFIAQEMQKVLPEVVIDYDFKVNEQTGLSEKVKSAYLGISYQNIIPVLIHSIQQQQQMIEEQNKKIEELKELITQASAIINAGNANNVKIDAGKATDAFLEQNVPNPFNQATTIRYKIPAGSNAQIAIYDQSGKLMKTLKASDSGLSQINANQLNPGTYTYTLSVNGKFIESKKMMIVR